MNIFDILAIDKSIIEVSTFVIENEKVEEQYVKMKISNLVREGKKSIMLQIFNCAKEFHLNEQI
jgi:hypothetical protein